MTPYPNPETVIYEGHHYHIAGMTNGYLLSPYDFGIRPSADIHGLYKARHKIIDFKLYLHGFTVNDTKRRQDYSSINGIFPMLNEEYDPYEYLYRYVGLKIEENFTGGLLLGSSEDSLQTLGWLNPIFAWRYHKLLEVKFEDGYMTRIIDHSILTELIRNQHAKDQRKDKDRHAEKMIKDAFTQEYFPWYFKRHERQSDDASYRLMYSRKLSEKLDHNDDEYCILGMTKGKLVSPQHFGIQPELGQTQDDYIAKHKIIDDQLHLKYLEIAHGSCQTSFESINGVLPLSYGETNWVKIGGKWEERTYKTNLTYYDLDIPESFTGGMIVGRDRLETSLASIDVNLNMVYHFNYVLEILFDKGRVTQIIDHSNTAKVVRQLYVKRQYDLEAKTRKMLDAFSQPYYPWYLAHLANNASD